MDTPLEPGTLDNVRASRQGHRRRQRARLQDRDGHRRGRRRSGTALIHAEDHEEGELLCETVERLLDVRRRCAGFAEILDVAAGRLAKAAGVEAGEAE
jgi:hypothetical protein